MPGSLERLHCALILTFFISPLSAADRFDGVRAHIRASLIEESVPSLAVAVVADGRILWEEGFGWANAERRVPATAHTPYSIASISKPITATALMTLVETGRIDLDRPANDYLGRAKLHACVGSAEAATVRRLADHTSGVAGHYQFFYADEPFRAPAMDETILRYGNLITAPGERFGYSNLGYGVLGYIIERTSGLAFEDFMRRRVFIPLGMTRSSVGIGQALRDETAVRYGKDALPLPLYDSDTPGAGDVFASAHDLARFALFHLQAHLPDQKSILSDATIQVMRDPTAESYLGGYGVGFIINRRNGRLVVSHSGGMGGVTTQMVLLPEANVAVVALSNSGNHLPFRITDEILSALLPDWRVAPPRESPKEAPFDVPSELLGTWRGKMATYVAEVPVELTFLPNDVHMKIGNQFAALVNEPKFRAPVFSGELAARIGTPDTDRYADIVFLSLTLRGDVLNGGATARATDDGFPRVRNALTHWLELRRVGQ